MLQRLRGIGRNIIAFSSYLSSPPGLVAHRPEDSDEIEQGEGWVRMLRDVIGLIVIDLLSNMKYVVFALTLFYLFAGACGEETAGFYW